MYRSRDRTARRTLQVLAALALLFGALRGAQAHGGQYRAPGPPPTGPGVRPPPVVPAVITPGDTWQTWWDLNRLGLLPGRDEVLREETITPRGDDIEGKDVTDAWARRRQLAAREQVVPFLLRLLDPKQKTRDEIRGAALIALGKACQDAAARTLLLYHLRDVKGEPVVRESAALGIGLLCRSRPALQLDGETLDALREALLEVLADKDAHDRVRAFSALGLALLGDQPWGSPYTKDGRLVVRALWQGLGPDPRSPDVPVAVLTAIGLQPLPGIPDAVLEGLRALVVGKNVAGRDWTPLERSHALSALARLQAPGVDALVLRLLARRNEDTEVRRSALLAIGRRAAEVAGSERVLLAEGAVAAVGKARDPTTEGLALVAAGRLLGADLEAGEVGVLESTKIPDALFDLARRGTAGQRGYATLALSLAARGARASGHALPFLERTKALLLEGLDKGRGDDAVRAVYAVGLGLLRVEEAVDPLLEVVRDDGAFGVLRGHAAVALGQIGRRGAEVRPVLRQLLDQRRDVMLRVRAAMALALTGDREVGEQLLAELAEAKSEYHRGHAVIALGRLGDLRTIPALVSYASDERQSELARALAVVALGLIVDPEPKPSLSKLREDANFPSATQVLYSAYAIF